MRTNERRPWPARLAFLAGSATISALLWSTVIGAPAPSNGAAAMLATTPERAPLEVPMPAVAALAADLPVDPAAGAALASDARADPSSAFATVLRSFAAVPERREDHERGKEDDEDDDDEGDEHEGRARPPVAPAPRPVAPAAPRSVAPAVPRPAAPAAPRPAAPAPAVAPAVARPAPAAPRPAPAAPALRTRAS